MKEVTENMTNCDTTKRGGYERDDEQYSFEKCKCSIDLDAIVAPVFSYTMNYTVCNLKSTSFGSLC